MPFYMYGSEEILFGQPFTDQDGVFIISAFPTHIRHQHILAQRQFPIFGTGTVCDHFSLGNSLPFVNNGPLVNACTLVAAVVFAQLIASLLSTI